MVFFLILPVWAAGDTEEERVVVEHLLWDIPFGIGVEECLALVKERTGLELVESFDFLWGDEYSITEGRGFTWFGYPARLSAHFDPETGGLIGLRLGISFEESWRNFVPSDEDETLLTEKFERSFAEVMEIYREVERSLGAPTGGVLWFHSMLNETVYLYAYPMQSGVLDEAFVIEFFSGLEEDTATASLITNYGNVLVSVRTTYRRITSWGVQKPISIVVQYTVAEGVSWEGVYTFQATDEILFFGQ